MGGKNKSQLKRTIPKYKKKKHIQTGKEPKGTEYRKKA